MGWSVRTFAHAAVYPNGSTDSCILVENAEQKIANNIERKPQLP
jgi:hypothetical protein